MDYKNPRLIRDKEKTKKRFMSFVFWLIGIAFCGAVYGLLFSPFFYIQNIQVNGLEKVKPENINKIIDEYRFSKKYFVFSKNNFWLFNKNNLQGKVFEHYYFEEFKIKKRLPNRIEINLKEKESAINWLTNNLCYHLDLTAMAIEYCEGGNGLLTIKDLRNEELKVGDSPLEKSELKYIVELNNQVKNIALDKLQLINIEKDDNLLDFTTEQGIMIRLNSDLTIGEQIARLDTLLNQQEIKDNFENLKYIDLRFGEKVYWK